MSHTIRRPQSGLPRRSLRALPRLALAVVLTSLVAHSTGCGDTLWDKATETFSVLTLTPTVNSFDPAPSGGGGTWATRPPMPAALSCETGVVAPSGRCYVLASGTNKAYRFDPEAVSGTGSWTTLPDLPEARTQAVAVTVGSTVCLASGIGTGGEIPGFVEILDDAAATPAWKRIPTPFRRFECCVVGLPDRLLIIGGRDDLGLAQRDIWELHPVTTTAFWRPIGFLSVERVLAGSFVLGAGPKVHVVSGHSGDGVALATEEVLDFGAGVVLPTVAIPTARIAPEIVVSGGRAFVFDSRLYAVGVTGRLDRFDPNGFGTGWTLRATHPNRFAGSSLGALPDGRLMTAGGYDGHESTTATVLYDDAADTWTAVTPGMPLDLVAGFLAVAGGRLTYFGGVNVNERRRKLDEDDFLGF